MISRRDTLRLGFAGAAAALLPGGASAEAVTSHGLSTFGDLKYAPDFPHFDYVNPVAPKGGVFSAQVSAVIFNQGFNSFDSLHIFSVRGDGAGGVENCFATLMARALDEPDGMYGLAAESVTASADRLTYRFRLRPGLTFHDGSALTAEDCAFSFMIMKEKGHPFARSSLGALKAAVAEAPDTLRVDLAPERGRDLPLVIAGLPIFSKTWWSTRDFEASSLERPLGSGAYRVGRFEPGVFVELERVQGWWGEGLPVEVGSNNFDVLRYQYYKDRDVAFEAFKARAFLFREEFTSRMWATGYDFPALKDGRVKQRVLNDDRPSGAQGWFMNTRRKKFSDVRVRQALGLAFDFEWTNRNVMFSSFDRTASFFQNSALMATGVPTPEELALLEPFRAALAPAVFGEAVLPPVSDGSGEDRSLLRSAVAMLREAGWTIRDQALRNEAGEAFEIEFLDDSGALERHTAPFIKNLERLGVAARFQVIDTSQFQARVDSFDFDMLVRRYSLGSTPGEGARNIWSSKAAAENGSWNLAGIADPVVDALIDKLVAANTRDELTTVCRALDRVLRAGHYWVPQWYKASHWLAYWDVYDFPPEKPRYDLGAPSTWWAKPA